MSLHRLVILTGATILLIAVTGCGDDSSDVDTGQAPTTSTAPTTTEAHGDDAEHEDMEDMAEHGDEADQDDGATDSDVIEVEMVEFGFEGGPFEAPTGQPVTFRFTNTGAVAHEAMFGDPHQQEEFAAMGDGHDHGDGHHGTVQAITVQPGETAELTVTLEDGEQLMGCHLPGHYDAGMVAPVAVS